MREYTRTYVKESIPRKQYRRRVLVSRKSPQKIFFSDILIALFIIAMLAMLIMNYISNRDYVPVESQQQEQEIDISVDIEETKLEEKSSILVSPFIETSSF